MNSIAAKAIHIPSRSRLFCRPIATYGAKLAGKPSSAYDRLISPFDYMTSATKAPKTPDWTRLTPREVLELFGNTFKLIPLSQRIALWSDLIVDSEAPIEYWQMRLQCHYGDNLHHQRALQRLGFASQWCQQRLIRPYSENAGGRHLFAYTSHSLPGLGMHTKEQYMCTDARFGPSRTGRADLGGQLRLNPHHGPHIGRINGSLHGLHRHRVTAFILELKTPEGMEPLCRALIQVIMYAQSESMLATLQAHAQCLVGTTPWLVLGIGAGLGNFHLFAVSLPTLLSFKGHLEAQVDPAFKLPMFVLSPIARSTCPDEESVNMEEVLRGASMMNPYRSTIGLTNFVQLMSFIGGAASEWAGVGGMGAEREAGIEMLLLYGCNVRVQ